MSAPSRWLQTHAPARPGRCLDLACGSGRNLRWLAARGWQVTGVDRDADAVAPLRSLGEIVVADIEGEAWPLAGESFDLVLICNYLWRPLFDTIQSSVAPGGWLIYETFADGQQHIGRPARADFLMQRGELLTRLRGWEITAFEDAFERGDLGLNGERVNARFVQRVAARRPQV